MWELKDRLFILFDLVKKVEDISVLFLGLYNWISENSLTSSVFLDVVNFISEVLKVLDNFKYFDLNFFVIFENFNLEVKNEFFRGFYIFFFLKFSICSILFSTSSISIDIGLKIIIWQSSKILLIIVFLFLSTFALITFLK